MTNRTTTDYLHLLDGTDPVRLVCEPDSDPAAPVWIVFVNDPDLDQMVDRIRLAPFDPDVAASAGCCGLCGATADTYSEMHDLVLHPECETLFNQTINY